LALTSKLIQTVPKYAFLRDEKATTVSGGASSAGLQTRTLNVLAGVDLSWITLDGSNRFTVSPGLYVYHVSAPGYTVGRHKAFLFQVGGANVLIGKSTVSGTGDNTVSEAIVRGVVEITEATQYEITHDTASGVANGLGLNTNDGSTEVYTTVEIIKLK